MIFNKKTNWYKLAAMSISEAYDILGLRPGVDQKTLRQTLRQKRRELHPDVNRDNPNAELEFQLTEQAAKLIQEIEETKARRTAENGANIRAKNEGLVITQGNSENTEMGSNAAQKAKEIFNA